MSVVLSVATLSVGVPSLLALVWFGLIGPLVGFASEAVSSLGRVPDSLHAAVVEPVGNVSRLLASAVGRYGERVLEQLERIVTEQASRAATSASSARNDLKWAIQQLRQAVNQHTLIQI